MEMSHSCQCWEPIDVSVTSTGRNDRHVNQFWRLRIPRAVIGIEDRNAIDHAVLTPACQEQQRVQYQRDQDRRHFEHQQQNPPNRKVETLVG
tara:strand:+ start:361 stop:636 length:276 start_codon:yes stop_codon:yes gene_type:complete